MQWEDMTALDFTAALRSAQEVCVLPLACIEKHGSHLPLGTDMFIGMEVARRATEREPAVVFPPFYLTQILEAKHQPGTISLGGRLMLEILETMCDEIGRNGFKKIILFVSHGGNRQLASFFLQLMLDTCKSYVTYLAQSYWDPGLADLREQLLESDHNHHGGEMETSMILAIRPELVKMDQVNRQSGNPLGRLQHLDGLLEGRKTPVSWYADFPDHYAGDASPATQEKGERFLDFLTERLVEVIQAVKQDTVAPELYQEFFSRTQH